MAATQIERDIQVIDRNLQRMTMTIRNDQQARQFAEMLAVPRKSGPPPCPLCDESHMLEQPCAPRDGFGPARERERSSRRHLTSPTFSRSNRSHSSARSRG